VGEEKERLMKNKMYKFSHIVIYSGDDEQEITVSAVHRTGNPVD
jgi:hypothetical protein